MSDQVPKGYVPEGESIISYRLSLNTLLKLMSS